MTRVSGRQILARGALAVLPLALLACSPAAEAPDVAAPGMKIPYNANSTLAVGQQTIVHGARGACGQTPPAWSSIDLPDLEHGVFVEGPVGTRRSRSCGGPTPARGVIYKAESPGTDSFELFGDPVVVTVQ